MWSRLCGFRARYWIATGCKNKSCNCTGAAIHVSPNGRNWPRKSVSRVANERHPHPALSQRERVEIGVRLFVLLIDDQVAVISHVEHRSVAVVEAFAGLAV